MSTTTLSPEDYLKQITNIIQKEGIRDTFVTQRRLKELNQIYPNNVVIYHSENIRGKCVVYFGRVDKHSSIEAYEFKLGKINKSKQISNALLLDRWEEEFNKTVRKSPHLDEIRDDIVSWADKHKSKKREFKQFLDTLNVYYHYTGQVIVAYKEFNGEWKKIKPIIQLYEPVSLTELIEFGKKKSRECWDRDFTCKVRFVNSYWKNQNATYCPEKKEISFSIYRNAQLDREYILDTMLHEMVHWHLHTTGKMYEDEDFEFIEECLRVGCSLSGDSKAQYAFMEYKQRHKVC